MRGTLKLSAGYLLVALLALAAQSAQARPIHIVAFGDSATAGWLVARKDAYPAQLQAALRKKGYDVVVDNAGMNGGTYVDAPCCISTKRSRRVPTSRSSNSAQMTCAAAPR